MSLTLDEAANTLHKCRYLRGLIDVHEGEGGKSEKGLHDRCSQSLPATTLPP